MKTFNNLDKLLAVLLLFAFSYGYSQQEIKLYDNQQYNALQLYELFDHHQEGEGIAIISQVGDVNIAQIMQNNTSLVKSNAVIISQQGISNIGSATQYGAGNELKLTQTGDNNKAEITMEGDLMKIITTQDGSNNNVIQDVTGSGATYTISQFGTNNSIEQRGDGFPQGYTITQTGNNMNISVERVSPFK